MLQRHHPGQLLLVKMLIMAHVPIFSTSFICLIFLKHLTILSFLITSFSNSNPTSLKNSYVSLSPFNVPSAHSSVIRATLTLPSPIISHPLQAYQVTSPLPIVFDVILEYR